MKIVMDQNLADITPKQDDRDEQRKQQPFDPAQFEHKTTFHMFLLHEAALHQESVSGSACQDIRDWRATLWKRSMKIVAKQCGNCGGNLIDRDGRNIGALAEGGASGR